MQETPVQFLGWEDPLEKGKATHSSILAWRIPWTVIETEIHIVFLGIESAEIIGNLILGDKEVVNIPLYTHIEHVLYMINELCQINHITAVLSYEIGYVCNDSRSVGAVQ